MTVASRCDAISTESPPADAPPAGARSLLRCGPRVTPDMSERRRTSRFVIPSYTHGVFRQLQDVCVETVHGDLVTLICDHPLQPLEQLLLELPRALGLRTVVQVEVHNCAIVWRGENRRYRITVRKDQTELP